MADDSSSSAIDIPGRPDSPPMLSPSTLPEAIVPEVSMVEEEAVTGVTFTPTLWMQRRAWALETLRKEAVRSVLDMGCGPGALLETLVAPASTVPEAPIRSLPTSLSDGKGASNNNETAEDELFIERLAGIDPSTSVIPSALAALSPPSPSDTFPQTRPRWQQLQTEMWLGGIEKYNQWLEGYEAITCMEVIEHLEPNILSRFGVVTMGTYRPRLLLVTTPNFDFNARFPHAVDHHDHDQPRKGFVDPTGRTERVFRHSDHKLEMTAGEFHEWATAAAADWGYEVELGGVGISSKPAYYPKDDPLFPGKPIYATQTAVFRLISAPMRSPRSVRSAPLPFMPSSKESLHSHKRAGRFTHPVTAPGNGRRESQANVRAMVKDKLAAWNVGQVSLAEIWAVLDIAVACAGSKRYLVSTLGGYGDCGPTDTPTGEFKVDRVDGRLIIRWNEFVPKEGGKRGEGGAGVSKSNGHGHSGGW